MKTINISFDDKEFAELLKIKKEKRCSWKQLLLELINNKKLKGGNK